MPIRYRIAPAARGLLVLALLATTIAVAAGCSRQLNNRYTFEQREAAVHFRQQGLYDLRNERLHEALTNFTEAVRVWPADAESHWNIGRIYLTIGDFARAERAFARAIAADQKTYGARTPEVLPLEHTDPEVAAALIHDREPPADADWVVDE